MTNVIGESLIITAEQAHQIAEENGLISKEIRKELDRRIRNRAEQGYNDIWIDKSFFTERQCSIFLDVKDFLESVGYTVVIADKQFYIQW